MKKEEILIRSFIEKYNRWLLDQGFCDADIIFEFDQCEPEYNELINEFLKNSIDGLQNNKRKNH